MRMTLFLLLFRLGFCCRRFILGMLNMAIDFQPTFDGP